MNPTDFVFFGGTGDLATRKLLPALYNLHRDGVLATRSRIIGIAREDICRADYVARAEESCARHVTGERFDASVFRAFAERVHYVRVDAQQASDFHALGELLQHEPAEGRVFYLSTSPQLFGTICTNLSLAGLANEQSRVVLEKPIGRDIASARSINDQVGRVFAEGRIFRIDHYLGKEPVQNLLALRFGNVLFEPLWNRTWVHDVQLTIAEEGGIGARGEFYDHIGALRDMVQSHLLQLLCIIAMEPPSSAEPDAVRDEKLKVLRALEPLEPAELAATTVRGQYAAGVVAGRPAAGYLQEAGIPPDSRTETFVAIKAGINSWRWSGVPFFLRTGKRMPQRSARIVVNFRPVPHALFPGASGGVRCNRMVIELQPDEELGLHLMAKTPGEQMKLGRVRLNLDFGEQFATRPMDAYERLLMDIARGQLTLFLRRDEVDAAWQWVEPLLRAWEGDSAPPLPYAAGTRGPDASNALVDAYRTAWYDDA